MKKSRVLSIAHAALALNLVAGCGGSDGGSDPALAEGADDSVASTDMVAAAADVTASSEASELGQPMDIEEAARRWGRRWTSSPSPAPAPSPAPSPSPSPSPAAATPAPSPAPAVSTGARQFATGFESGVSLPPSTAYGNTDQYPQGGDIPGYSFPLNLWSTPQQWRTWLLSVVGPSTPLQASSYATGQIMSVTGRNGSPTRALALVSKAKSPSTGVQQVTLQQYRPGVEPVMYQRMWVKFDQNTLDRARAVGQNFWQIFWEVKAEPDYRLRLQLRYDGGQLYWHTQGDVLTNATPIWQASLKSVPIVMASDSSASGWHKVEVWMNRPGGKFKVHIDGQQLIDYSGKLMGASGARVDQLKLAMVYSTVSPVTKTLFDDLEIWSSVPADAWRK
jgi:hypothetical protein